MQITGNGRSLQGSRECTCSYTHLAVRVHFRLWQPRKLENNYCAHIRRRNMSLEENLIARYWENYIICSFVYIILYSIFSFALCNINASFNVYPHSSKILEMANLDFLYRFKILYWERKMKNMMTWRTSRWKNHVDRNVKRKAQSVLFFAHK